MHLDFHWHRHKRLLGKHHLSRKEKKQIRSGVDRIILAIAIISPVMTLPQVFKIWYGQNAAGVSILSWSTYIVASSFWLLYGIFHRDRALILSSTLWIIVEVFIVIGTAIYG